MICVYVVVDNRHYPDVLVSDKAYASPEDALRECERHRAAIYACRNEVIFKAIQVKRLEIT